MLAKDTSTNSLFEFWVVEATFDCCDSAYPPMPIPIVHPSPVQVAFPARVFGGKKCASIVSHT